MIYCEEQDAKFFRGKLLYSQSKDGGKSWSVAKEIVKASGPTSPQITLGADDNALYVVYLDRRDQAVRMFFTKSMDAGMFEFDIITQINGN